MPKEFSVEFKQLAFSVIDFVEKEKNGPSIPLNNVTDPQADKKVKKRV